MRPRLFAVVLITTLASACSLASPTTPRVSFTGAYAISDPLQQPYLGASGNPILWVATGETLLGFASTDNGNVPPQFVVDGPNTNIQSFETATDGRSSVYVMGPNNADWQVSRFRPDSNGNRRPGEVINCSIPSEFDCFAVGRDGRVVVSNLNNGTNEVDIVSVSSVGCSKGYKTISGPSTQLAVGPIAIGPQGAIYTTNQSGGIIAFAHNASGNADPIKVIEGPHTKLDGPLGIAIDGTGRIYVANFDNSITVYRASANGDATPVQRVYGPTTELYYPDSIALAPDGRIFVANFDTDAITVYAPGATGNVAPIQVIAGSATGLIVEGNEEQISIANM